MIFRDTLDVHGLVMIGIVLAVEGVCFAVWIAIERWRERRRK